MEVTALCFRVLVTEFILLGTQVDGHYTQKSDSVFLRVTPDRQQYFEYEYVSVHCEGLVSSLRFRGISNMTNLKLGCELKKTTEGLSCTFEKIYALESGEYWCETEGGERSSRVNITVTDGSVILESPVHPVREGDAVTLRCRTNMSAANLQARFFKDGVDMKTYFAEKTIKNVSKSDEGMYRCSIKDAGKSPESWLAVTANRRPPVSPSPRENFPSRDFWPVFILWTSVSIVILSLVLLLVGFLWIMRPRVSLKTETSASHSKDDKQNDSEEDSDSVMYTVVFTKPNAADCADNNSQESNQSSKPQSGEDDDESVDLTIYSALAVSETPQTLQHEPESSSSTMNLDSTEQEVTSTPV